MSQPKEKFLKDYRPPAFFIDTVHLTFEIHEHDTVVDSSLVMRRASHASSNEPLVLSGGNLELLELRIGQRKLGPDEFRMEEDQLFVPEVGDDFVLNVKTRINPKKNTSLSGLYASGDLLCTQCEAEGFRRITYYLDRPDVLAKFTTTIRGDQNDYPVMLSNGNLVDSGHLDDGRHFATWVDPFPKPSYLFALVAGDLAVLKDEFTTMGGRQVLLEIYSTPSHIEKCHHAMASLKQAMSWDEQVFGLEYDLDRYMIVAVPDFNMGAMENKGLNIFNTSTVLASQKTATDTDYQRVRGVIGHEYFHNWTGNRVTCRDWFQLSLKEGLTVFRDQQFTSDVDSRTVKRIQDVQLIRNRQFPEDAGPMAHPIRPESYIEMNNFYTVTVYFKGAEVIRMMHTLLGQNGFRRGMDLYFSRHDGQAVTCEDFVSAMEDANKLDLSQFRLWYSQAGTPKVEITPKFDAAQQVYELEFKQTCPATPGQPHKEAFHIPVKLGLLDSEGKTLNLAAGKNITEIVLDLRKPKQTFRFRGVKEEPIPSLFRDFSAPLQYSFPYSPTDLCFLLAHDPSEFNRWDAGQILFKQLIFSFVEDLKNGIRPQLSEEILNALERCLEEASLDPALVSQILNVPALVTLSQDMNPLELDVLHQARESLVSQIASGLRDRAKTVYHTLKKEQAGEFDQSQAGQRALKNRCLAILTRDGNDPTSAWDQFQSANNMTDQLAALVCLSHDASSERTSALDAFYRQWHDEALVMDKWFAIQALSRHPGTIGHVNALSESEDFTLTNPNRVYALVHAFAGNMPFFHHSSGDGYAFVAEKVRQLDRLNPQVAARVVRAFSDWKRFDANRQHLMRRQLEQIKNLSGLSKDVFEIVTKSLA